MSNTPFGGGFPGASPFELRDDTPVYVISVAAQLSGLHPQTLRQYDRLGLVSPDRAPGRGRRYSARDIVQLREVQRMSQEEGINLAGIKRILELENQVAALRAEVERLGDALRAAMVAAARRERDVHASYRRDLVPLAEARDRGSVVVWQPRHSPHDL